MTSVSGYPVACLISRRPPYKDALCATPILRGPYQIGLVAPFRNKARARAGTGRIYAILRFSSAPPSCVVRGEILRTQGWSSLYIRLTSLSIAPTSSPALPNNNGSGKKRLVICLGLRVAPGKPHFADKRYTIQQCTWPASYWGKRRFGQSMEHSETGSNIFRPMVLLGG